MRTLRATQAELSLVTFFDRPAFHLWSNNTELYAALAESLTAYGFRASDLRWEQGSGAADAKLVLHLLSYGLTVRLRVDQLEIQSFDLARVDAQVGSAAQALLGVLSNIRNVFFQAHVVSLALHGELQGASVADYLRPFVREAPAGLGDRLV